MFEDDVADGGGDDRDGEVLDGEDVVEGDEQSFACAVGAVEFAHKQVGIEEEDDGCDFDQRSPKLSEEALAVRVLGHGFIVQNSS